MYKFTSETSMRIRLVLIKMESGSKSLGKNVYSKLASCSLLIRFTLNSVL
jgi:hypothetical protein